MMSNSVKETRVRTRERIQRARALGFAVGLLLGAVVGSVVAHALATAAPSSAVLIGDAEVASSMMTGSTFFVIPLFAVCGGLLGYFIGKRLVKRRSHTQQRPWG